MDSRRLAYLDAMGIDVWQSRDQGSPVDSPASEPAIVMGSVDSDILCIVGSQSEAQLKLAMAIGAAMRCTPIWAWPVPESEQAVESHTVASAVSEKMLTRILVFGEDLSETVLGQEVPEVVSTARVHVVPGLESIAGDQEAKRTLWRLMNEHGIAANRSG